MATRFVLSTTEKWTAYGELTGETSPTTVKPGGTALFSSTEIDQALYRATSYILNTFYRKFKPEFQADTFETLPQCVQDDLTVATNIAAGHELLTPNTYSVTISHNNATGIQLKKKTVGPITNEYFEQKSGDTVTRVQNEQTHDLQIHTILDDYLKVSVLNPVDPDCPEVPFAFGVTTSGS
ncbi:MAG: hypothetical protein K0U41_02005 [Gammaproteobacteria bacterium]|nr:hypothetical protein [Gammaproteobacteria bacterium]